MKRIVLYALIMLLAAGGVNGQASLTGTVTNDQGSSIAGAAIHILNTEITVVSDSGGRFTISRLASGRYTMQLSAVGYTTLARPVVVNKGDNALGFKLANSLTQLDAVT